MKKSSFVILWGLSVLISTWGGGFLARSHRTEWQSQSLQAQVSNSTLHHIVLFNLKDHINTEGRAKIVEAGETLLSEIPGVIDVQLGDKARADRQVHIKNYDLALYVLFESNADLDVYTPHKNHQQFIQIVSPMLEESGIQVIDFYGQ